MDRLETKIGLSPFWEGVEHLYLYLNGERFDEFLAKRLDGYYFGLIPAWLDYYDDDFIDSRREKEYVWQQTKLEGNTKILPILLCCDDFDFSCTVVVVEVIDEGETVCWNRLGQDTTGFDPEEKEFPKYIGKEVKWFENIGPFIFAKNEYLECIEAFLAY